MNLHDVPVGVNAPHEVNVIIEIPQGSSQKMEYDQRYGIMRLDRTLYSPLYYPYNYGFIPSTLYLDEDPLDILVLCNHPIPMNTLVKARPVGVLRMHDDKGPDDKIISVFAHDPRYEHMTRLTDISEHRRKEIVHFFQVYKDLEDKTVDIEGWFPVEIAHELISKYTVTHE
jgi:inorganic pyrophosphatase